MGCGNSKQRRCRHCRTAYSPMPRSYSVQVVHPPQGKGDNYHLVALTSTTLGSLSIAETSRIGIGVPDGRDGVRNPEPEDDNSMNGKEEFLLSVIEAKTWSNMIEGKIPKKTIPKTPCLTPPGEPETINAWEIMEGLEEWSPLNLAIRRSLSFAASRCEDSDKCERIWKSKEAKPIRHQPIEDNSEAAAPPLGEEDDGGKKAKERVVIYFTSLRGVRKTFEDCCNVKVILEGLGVRLDERDVSMHSGFKEELRDLLGDAYLRRQGRLPRVFIGKKYIGGADEIKKLHEEGQLEKLLEICEKVEGNTGGKAGSYGKFFCSACGDIRFVPCESCSGSCKVFYDAEDGGQSPEHVDSGDSRFHRCPDCNENGLVRCPFCCY